MEDLRKIFEQRRANRRADTITIPAAFTAKFPTLKPAKAERLFRRYLDVVIEALGPRLPFLRDGETYVSTEALLHKCGKFNVAKKTHHVWNEFKDLFPLMTVLEKGSNLRATTNPYEKNTRVRVSNERFITMLLHERSPQAIYEHHYSADDENAVTDAVYIDMPNLERYIGYTEYELTKATGDNHRAKLQRNLWQALLVRGIGKHTEAEYGRAMLPLIPSASPFGRVYYRGLNVQNVSKHVRSAMIGHHFQYDMNAAVYAIKLFIYGEISGGDNALVGTTRGTYTRQYLAEKNTIRNRLARECFEGINLAWDNRVRNIKNALTAIGFGARTSGKTWFGPNGLEGTALEKILVAPVARERFLADPWVQSFIAEQRDIEEAILAWAQDGDGYEDMCQAIRDGQDGKGRVTRATKMAYIYQQAETRIMDAAVEVLAAHGIQPIARIHDAFIVRDRLSAAVLDDIRVAWGLRDYMTLDAEEVRQWGDPDRKRALDRADADLAEHRAHIEHEQLTARRYMLAKAGAA